MSATTRCLLKAGAPGGEILRFYAEMTAGDYDYCLQAVTSMVRVTDSSKGKS